MLFFYPLFIAPGKQIEDVWIYFSPTLFGICYYFLLLLYHHWWRKEDGPLMSWKRHKVVLVEWVVSLVLAAAFGILSIFITMMFLEG
jgi:predicted outer membrane lipoprotein